MSTRQKSTLVKLNVVDCGEEHEHCLTKAVNKRVHLSPEISKSRHRKLTFYTYDHPIYTKMQDVVIDLIDRMEEILEGKENERVELGEKKDRKQLALRLPYEQAEKLRRHRALTGESVPKVLAKLIDSLPEQQ